MGKMKEISAQLLTCEKEAIDALRRLSQEHPRPSTRQKAIRLLQDVENEAVERIVLDDGASMIEDARIWTSKG